jgi:formiminoglutamase
MSHPDEDLLSGSDAPPDPRDPRASTLLGPASDLSDAGWALAGIPWDGGIPGRPGARFGPGAFRQALGSFGTHSGGTPIESIADLGDLSLSGASGGEAHRRIEDAARRIFSRGGRAIFVGGDHGCTGSIVRGLAAARPAARLALIGLDAHLDVREYESEDALSSGTPFRRAIETRILSADRVSMVGLRPFANSGYYLDWAKERGIRTYSVDEVAAMGAAGVVEAVLRAIPDEVDAIYLSIDLDAADAAFAPGVSAPGIGGLSAREMIALVGAIAADSRLIGADIMELSPPYDVDARTARLAARLFLELLWRAGSGRRPGVG